MTTFGRHRIWTLMPVLGVFALACSEEKPTEPPVDDLLGPSAVADLAVSDTAPSTATLRFTAPADDAGTVTEYDLRLLPGDVFPDTRFETATRFPAGTPATPGAGETILVTGLTESSSYAFRIRSRDDSGNWSGLSAAAAGVTKPLRPLDPGLSFDPGCPGSFPLENALGGNLPPDAIPALLDPEFLTPDQVDYLLPTDRVFGVEVNGVFFALPRKIMNFHEVANFTVGDVRVSATWCPLTFSFVEWRADWQEPDNLRKSSFGVSGSIMDNNLVIYDRESLSNFQVATVWSQLAGVAFDGPRSGECMRMGRNTVDTTYDVWLRLHPDTRILTNQNQRTLVKPEDYRENPYERYWAGLEDPPEAITFPDPRLDDQTVVLGVHGRNGSAAVLIDDAHAVGTVGGTPVVFLSQPATRTVFVFENVVDGASPQWSETDPDASGLPRFRDAFTGSVWTLDGIAVEGPKTGTRLAQVPAFHVYWFGWATFFRDFPILNL